MARKTKLEKTTPVYKETLYTIIDERGAHRCTVSRQLGYHYTYLNNVYKGRDCIFMDPVRILALQAILGCSYEELTAKPEPKEEEEDLMEIEDEVVIYEEQRDQLLKAIDELRDLVVRLSR